MPTPVAASQQRPRGSIPDLTWGAEWKVASFSVNMGSAPVPTAKLGARQVRT